MTSASWCPPLVSLALERSSEDNGVVFPAFSRLRVAYYPSVRGLSGGMLESVGRTFLPVVIFKRFYRFSGRSGRFKCVVHAEPIYLSLALACRRRPR